MTRPRRICIVTGTRADYGLLYWIMRGVEEHPRLELQVAATGMHLSPEFGLTYRTVEQDGFSIDEKVEMLLSGDSPVAIAKSVGLGTIGFADAFARLQPDILLVLGDRFEILAAAQAGMVARIPVAHVHGGEVTEGAIDDSIRHSITKMAHWHFAAAEPFRQRIIQMGEAPSRVFAVGAPGLDYLEHLDVMSQSAMEASLNVTLREPTFLVTYHPATLGDRSPREAIGEVLQALDAFPEAQIIFTRANADTEGRVINQAIDAYVEARQDRTSVYTSLGQQRYLSLLHYVDVVIGNSSSGIIEAPSIPVATVNIGDRQKGRPRASSVIDCEEDAASIVDAIAQARSPGFKKRVAEASSPYGAGGASRKIVERLSEVALPAPRKQFYDIERRPVH